MRCVDPGNDFETWRNAARGLLAENIPPHEILWEPAGGLFTEKLSISKSAPASVPTDFLTMARTVACHVNPSRWALLYQVLWRIIKNGERSLLEIPSDRDVSKLRIMEKSVRREIHKLHAFVRFRKAGESVEGRERFVAWFEPEHFSLKPATPFFCKRFANMDWSIFTPKECAHWIDGELHFTPGVPADPSQDMDELEDVWRTYYSSIFNPARLKIKAMQTEMPKRYWKNLPEADLIDQLIRDSKARVNSMLDTAPRQPRPEPKNPCLQNLKNLSESTDASLHARILACRECPLWERSTRAVPGEGPLDARLMIIGEQPGDSEDLEGRPFVGPAGLMLDQALAEAGINRTTAYLTNAVKHFKWAAQGKRRLHITPLVKEVLACQHWLLEELALVRPQTIIILGNTAARALLGPGIQALKQRGEFPAPELAPRVILTVHPSYLLRLPDLEHKEKEYQHFIQDLRLVHSA